MLRGAISVWIFMGQPFADKLANEDLQCPRYNAQRRIEPVSACQNTHSYPDFLFYLRTQ